MENNKILERFLSQEFTPKVKTYYRSILSGFQKYLHTIDKDFHNFEIEDVKDYYDKKMVGEIGSEWGKGSVGTFLTVLQSFCKWLHMALDEMMIGKSPEELDKLLKEKVRLNRVITMKRPRLVEKIKSEIKVDLNSLSKMFSLMIQDRHNHNKKKFAFKRFWLICWFGCRVGEIVSISPDMVNILENKIHFITEKTIVERVNFYDDFTKQFLEEYLDDNSLINITERAYQYSLSRYTEKAGRKVYTKIGREAWNTNMKGVIDDNFIKVVCGHSIKGLRDISEVYRVYPQSQIKEIMMEKHYLIPLEEDLQKLLDKY